MSYPDNLVVLVDGPVDVAVLPKVSADAFANLVRNRGALFSVTHFLGYLFDVEHKISRNYSHHELAELLVMNNVCEDASSALADISDVIGTPINGMDGSYRWNEKVDPATGEKQLYMSYVSHKAHDPI